MAKAILEARKIKYKLFDSKDPSLQAVPSLTGGKTTKDSTLKSSHKTSDKEREKKPVASSTSELRPTVKSSLFSILGSMSNNMSDDIVTPPISTTDQNESKQSTLNSDAVNGFMSSILFGGYSSEINKEIPKDVKEQTVAQFQPSIFDNFFRSSDIDNQDLGQTSNTSKSRNVTSPSKKQTISSSLTKENHKSKATNSSEKQYLKIDSSTKNTIFNIFGEKDQNQGTVSISSTKASNLSKEVTSMIGKEALSLPSLTKQNRQSKPNNTTKNQNLKENNSLTNNFSPNNQIFNIFGKKDPNQGTMSIASPEASNLRKEVASLLDKEAKLSKRKSQMSSKQGKLFEPIPPRSPPPHKVVARSSSTKVTKKNARSLFNLGGSSGSNSKSISSARSILPATKATSTGTSSAAKKQNQIKIQSKTTTKTKPGKTFLLSNSPFSFIQTFPQKSTNPYNDNIPILTDWKQNKDGRITGKISNSSIFKTGQKIVTSPVTKGVKEGVVTTNSGSKYRLL